jgi:hypothetical protein
MTLFWLLNYWYTYYNILVRAEALILFWLNIILKIKFIDLCKGVLQNQLEIAQTMGILLVSTWQKKIIIGRYVKNKKQENNVRRWITLVTVLVAAVAFLGGIVTF